jgi:hypothetical protein
MPDQFEKFLNREQRDPGLNELLYPFYTTDKSAEMIQKFETDESFRKKSNKLKPVDATKIKSLFEFFLCCKYKRTTIATGSHAIPDGL